MSQLSGFLDFVQENKQDAVSLLYLVEEDGLEVEVLQEVSAGIHDFVVRPQVGPIVTVRCIPSTTTKVSKTFRTQRALHGAKFPVPEPLAYCDDSSYLGSSFIVEAHVPGRVLSYDDMKVSIPIADRSRMLLSLVAVLGMIHKTKPSTAGLSSSHSRRRTVSTEALNLFSNFQNNVSQRHGGRSCETCRNMHDLHHWLQNWPQDELELNSDDKLVFIHGSFDMKNITWDLTESKVVAIGGWHNAGVGNPLLDFYQCFAPFILDLGSSDSPVLKAKSAKENSTVRLETLEWEYGRVTSSRETFAHANAFKLLALFRLACMNVGEEAHSLEQVDLVNASLNLLEDLPTDRQRDSLQERIQSQELELETAAAASASLVAGSGPLPDSKLESGLSVKKLPRKGSKSSPKNRMIWIGQDKTRVMIGKGEQSTTPPPKPKSSSASAVSKKKTKKPKSLKLSDIVTVKQGPDEKLIPEGHKVSHPSRYFTIVTQKSSIQLIANSTGERDTIANELLQLISTRI